MPDIPTQLRYTSSHLWIECQEDGSLKLGVTDHAQSQLGEVVFIELPDIDDSFTRDDECALIESVSVTREILCPVDGTIADINLELEENPELINIDPYGEGWLLLLKPEAAMLVEDFFGSEQYHALIDGR